MTLLLRAAAYTPNGARLGVLPTPQGVQGSMVFGDVGAFSLDYPKTAPKSPWLAAACEVALEVSWDGGQSWYEPDDARYLRLRRKGDQVDAPNTVSYEGPSYLWLLEKSKVLPEGKLNADGKRPFLSATVGQIMGTLMAEAKARGELPAMTTGTWSTTTDSSGQPWGKVVTLYYEPGVNYLTVLRNLHDQGMVDFTLSGRDLRLYRGDEVMAGASGASLLKGRDLTEAPYTGTLEGLATHVFLMGDDGLTFERTNPEAPAPWGRWTEYISQGGVSDTGTMTTLSDATLSLAAAERVENTYGLDFTLAKALPFRDYSLGRTIAVTADPAAPAEELRLRQITLTRDDKGTVSGNVVLNDRFLENEVRQSRRVQGISGGSALDGGSGARPTDGEDKTIPVAPTALASSSQAYFDDEGKVFARVALEWAAVTENTDGTLADDVASYEPQWKLSSDTVWSPLPTVTGTSVSLGGFQPNTNYDFRVRAVDSAGHRSAWSAAITDVTEQDAVAPGKPSAPAVTPYLGQLLLAWDGTLASGGTPPTDFSRAELHLTTANVAPTVGDTATLVDTITDRTGGSSVATGLTYGATYYGWLILVDRAGNASAPSDSVAGVPPKAAAGDIESITANQITAGAISAAITISGRIATALTGARVELNNQGLKAYNSSGQLTVDVPSSGTGATFTGVFKTAFSGARAELKAVTGLSELQLYSGVSSETSPGRVYSVVTGSGSTANAGIVLEAPRSNSLTSASIQLYSRDADSGADMIVSVYNGSVYWAADVGYGTHRYRITNTTADWLQIYAREDATRGRGVNMLAPTGDWYLQADNAMNLRAVKNTITLTGETGMYLYANGGTDVNVIGGLDHSSGNLIMTDQTGTERLRGLADSTSQLIRSMVLYNRKYTGAANVYCTSSGTLGFTTSLERHKVAIDRQWGEAAPLAAIKALTPATYYDRANAERYARLVDPEVALEDADDDAEHPHQYLGLIAEDVEALGLELLVNRDAQGELTGVAYERVALALIPWLRELDARLTAQELRAASVDSQT